MKWFLKEMKVVAFCRFMCSCAGGMVVGEGGYGLPLVTLEKAHTFMSGKGFWWHNSVGQFNNKYCLTLMWYYCRSNSYIIYLNRGHGFWTLTGWNAGSGNVLSFPYSWGWGPVGKNSSGITWPMSILFLSWNELWVLGGWLLVVKTEPSLIHEKVGNEIAHCFRTAFDGSSMSEFGFCGILSPHFSFDFQVKVLL